MQKAQENLIKYIYSYAHSHVPGWETITIKDLVIENTIGITNKTYIVRQVNPQITPKAIIFRVFGEACEGIYLDRNNELDVISQLSAVGMAPKFYLATDKVRIEEYLENEVLQQSQMRQRYCYRKIAENLAVFHNIQIQGVNQTPLALRILQPNGEIIKAIRSKCKRDEKFTERERERLHQLSDWFKDEELDFLRERLPKNPKSVCFSHNDMLANNILICPPNNKIVFIDFEYSSYNYRAFDIGNYFAESQYDYSNPNPPYFFVDSQPIEPAKVKDFIEVYVLTQMGKIQDKEEVASTEAAVKDIIQQMTESERKQFDQTVNEIYQEYPICSMLSHFLWGGWALHMSHTSDINFDYVEFSYERFKKYLEEKQKLLYV